MQNGGASAINCGKATADRHVKLIRIRDFLAVSAESGCNIAKEMMMVADNNARAKIDGGARKHEFVLCQ